MTLGEDPIEHYWRLRNQVLLYDVPEKPLEIKAPDALALLERVFSRRIETMRPCRGRYAIACTPSGGIVMDGIVFRLAENHFWYVTADGEFETWLIAHSDGLNVQIRDSKSHVLQMQGPDSLKVLSSAALPEHDGRKASHS